VTGVQTCALPISLPTSRSGGSLAPWRARSREIRLRPSTTRRRRPRRTLPAPGPGTCAGRRSDSWATRRVRSGTCRRRARSTRISPSRGCTAAPCTRALAHGRLGHAAEVEADRKRAIDLAPDRPEVWITCGFARSAVHDDDGGIADLTHAIDLDPVRADGYRHRAYLWEKMRQRGR